MAEHINLSANEDVPDDGEYRLRISRLTVDKLGVKLYDKASAVVAELIANSYDADAETVTVRLPLNVHLATVSDGQLTDRGFVIEVVDDGHGMTPEEAIRYYLRVGSDRRTRKGDTAAVSRQKKRPVMGRKGIGKLAPFGICRKIEVWSAGGTPTEDGYQITHFFMDFDSIVRDEDTDVPLERGIDDRKFSPKPGSIIRLTNFLAKRVPDRETFLRQLAVRFTFARPDFHILVSDTSSAGDETPQKVNPLDIPLLENSYMDLSNRPVVTDDGQTLKVKGWLGMAKEAYKNEEMMGVRIYAREKIVGTTRDFNQPAGFTGEFAMRSYLVGQVEAEWLDDDDTDDVVRTDRQDILWDSDKGQLLRKWGAEAIKEIARRSTEPRRARTRDIFLQVSDIAERAKERFGDKKVAGVAVDLARKLGGFAAEDELGNQEYVRDLSDIILSVAPHQALMEAFHEFSNKATKGNVTLTEMVDIFDKAQLAELASYAQIASQRVKVIRKLEEVIDATSDEDQFQALLSEANWLIEPSWTVITKNQGLKAFKAGFEAWWKKRTGSEIVLAITYENKRPDFTLISFDGKLRIVEIKKAEHDFDDADLGRLINYVDAFDEFFETHKLIASEFPKGYQIDLVADGVDLKDKTKKLAYGSLEADGRLVRVTWRDFLLRARKVHEEFLDVHELGTAQKRAAQ